MLRLFESVANLRDGAEVLRRRAHGVIEVAQGRLRRVVLRPFPKLVSMLEISLTGRWCHGRRPGDWCLLYYDQPRRFPSFLAVKYLVSARHSTYGTLRRALDTLDEIARLKQTDALLCQVSNRRISGRMLARCGWEPHCPAGWRRHYIKRFYGDYPPPAGWILSAACPGAVWAERGEARYDALR